MYVCLIFAVHCLNNWRKIFNSENFPIYSIDKPSFRALLTVTFHRIYSIGAVKKLVKHVSTERGIWVDEATVNFPLQSTKEVKHT